MMHNEILHLQNHWSLLNVRQVTITTISAITAGGHYSYCNNGHILVVRSVEQPIGSMAEQTGKGHAPLPACIATLGMLKCIQQG